ncbi:MAG: TonB-dependent receptor [Bacteroidota bacterium]
MSRNATLLGLVALLLAFGTSPAVAQTVTGTVTDESTGEPLPFVNILLQNTQRGTTTNLDGEYSIDVDGPESVLVFRFIGYIEQEQMVGDRTMIDVSLAQDSNLLDEAIVVGYGTQRRGDVTSSVAGIDIEEADVGLVTSASDYLEGRVAGVQLTPTGGQPGAGVSIRIRGGTSITASNEPLYVIDGVPIDGRAVTPGGSGQVSNSPAGNPLSLINPNDIETISVLKDASATAIYGSRGANGVVLITTRNGSQGRTTITYEGQAAVSSSPRFDLLSADEYRAFFQRTDLDFGDESGPARLAGLEVGNVSTDFQDEVFRDAVSQSHNFSFSSGTDVSQYRGSLSYLNNEGTVISTGQERITARLNANNQFFDNRFRVGLNLTSALTNDDFAPINATGGFEGGALQNLIDYRPILPVRDANNGDPFDDFYEVPGQRSVRNPVALLEQVDESARTTRTLGNISAEVDLMEGLTIQGLVGGDRSVGQRRSFIPSANPFGADFGGTAYRQTLERTSTTISTYLNYAPQIAENQNLDLLAGYEYSEFDTQQFAVQGQDIVTDVTGADAIRASNTPVFDPNDAGPGSFSNRAVNRLRSYFARANYNFDQKYYLTASLRRDGSSRFSPDNRFAIFPAVSAAWRLSEESFLSSNTVLTDLRLRGGFGIVGNQDIPDYLYLDLLGITDTGVFNGVPVRGFSQVQISNPDLKWEQKQEITVGLDYGLFRDRIYGSLEFYRNTTEDLLLFVPIPGAAVESQLQNIGSLRNTGIDFAIEGFLIDQPGLSLRLNGVFNTNQNEVVELGGREFINFGPIQGRGQSGTNSLRLEVGQPFPVFYGPEFADSFDEDGNPQFFDADNNVTSTLDDAERRNIGSPDPDFSYGFGFNLQAGDFGLRTFFRGEQGREIFNNGALVYGSRSAVLNGLNFIEVDYAFRPEDGEALSAAPVFSSRYIENASFLRLDNVTLEYNIPTEFFGSYVSGVRAFLSADNLFVITPYSGLDPEVNTSVSSITDEQGNPTSAVPSRGVDYLNYPRPRTISIGAVLSL